MKIVLFYHSLLSDWNHGNAHFLRGVATELMERGADVVIYEPKNGWSLSNLIAALGREAVQEFYRYYPKLTSIAYDAATIDLGEALHDADLVIVHEWNEPGLVRTIGKKRRQHSFKLLFHDTHHRAVTDRKSMQAYDLTHYDGVLAFGNVIRDVYLKKGWARKAWTWHEAADTRIFKPLATDKMEGDLIWIGNWGDNERTKELQEFLIEPVKELGLKAKIFGVRYPVKAKKELLAAGIDYGGWLPNFKVPEQFARYRMTVHVPRGPYSKSLPGIPTIRPFEALACAIPLLSAPWHDTEHLFHPGRDFQYVKNKAEMKKWMQKILSDDVLMEEMTASGLATIRQRHTCAHRVDELFRICEELGVKNSTMRKPITI